MKKIIPTMMGKLARSNRYCPIVVGMMLNVFSKNKIPKNKKVIPQDNLLSFFMLFFYCGFTKNIPNRANPFAFAIRK